MTKFNKTMTFLSIVFMFFFITFTAMASSHREAPLISNDPLADNTDVYAFRSPDNPNTVTIIANYIPMQLPHGGPNYFTFGENIRYEIHIDNDATIPGDEIVYRFTFNIIDEDPTTFFNIRLGQQNRKTTYTMERSMDGGVTFQIVLQNAIVPPNNIGPRSIESDAGLNTTYESLFNSAITNTVDGERVFAGPVDDPFFVDLGGIFDLGNAPRQDGTPRDGLECLNVHSIAIQIPISMLLKEGAASIPVNILDGDYVIGVWASASRPAIRTLNPNGTDSHSGDWVQVSRLGMPLTNEAIIPIGAKDFWNAISPYDEIMDTSLDGYFYNPELALYMDGGAFGGAVPAFSSNLHLQTASLGAFDFSNGGDGLWSLKGSDAVSGTALDDAIFGNLLLPGPGMPRSVDLWPAFHTGVPNFPPYQLATGKEGNPLAIGKPFVNNFLPNGGDMLRLNMAVPVTPRNDANFSSLGLIQAAVLGLTDPTYASNADLQFIPNMDGFPNGRRLEDDVTRIELQAVSGVVLAAIGLWYDDYDATNSEASPVTPQLIDVLTYTTGIEADDREFTGGFPFESMPRSGTGECSGRLVDNDSGDTDEGDTADLSLSVSNTTGTYTPFINTIFAHSLTNNGTVAVSGVEVMVEVPSGHFFTSASTPNGIFNLQEGKWTTATIATGETAVFYLTAYPTIETPVTYYSQVLSSPLTDPDSTPGNGNGISPQEDDEAAMTLNAASNSVQERIKEVVQLAPIEEYKLKLYPTAIESGAATVLVDAPRSGNGQIQIVNQLGRTIQTNNIQLSEGRNRINLLTDNLNQGIYFVKLEVKGAEIPAKRLIKK
jgi:hypothetical protein